MSQTTADAQAAWPPRIAIPDSAVEALKWLALVFMTIDHINSYLFDHGVGWMYAVGRIAMPLFAAVLAYNLARPGTLARGGYPRAIRHLLLFGVLATPQFIAGGGTGDPGSPLPLNILFLFAAAAGYAWLVDRGTPMAISGAIGVFLIGGLLAEFWHPGLGLAVALWHYFRRPSWGAAAAALACWLLLYLVNLNFWALLAIPILLSARHWRLKVPRIRWAFYVYYPAHIAVLWAIQQWWMR